MLPMPSVYSWSVILYASPKEGWMPSLDGQSAITKILTIPDNAKMGLPSRIQFQVAFLIQTVSLTSQTVLLSDERNLFRQHFRRSRTRDGTLLAGGRAGETIAMGDCWSKHWRNMDSGRSKGSTRGRGI
jgi:hypothetical protein